MGPFDLAYMGLAVLSTSLEPLWPLGALWVAWKISRASTAICEASRGIQGKRP